MKQRLMTHLLSILAVLFAVFAIGFFAGRNSLHATIVTTETAAEESAVPLEITQELPQKQTKELPSGASQGETVSGSAENNKININTADLWTLTQLDGIGEVLAQRIMDYRDTHGAFTSVEQLSQVPGIGEGKMKLIRDHVTTGE